MTVAEFMTQTKKKAMIDENASEKMKRRLLMMKTQYQKQNKIRLMSRLMELAMTNEEIHHEVQQEN